GPSISSLRIADGVSPVAGGTIQLEAALASSEPGASVVFTQDFNPLGTADTLPFRVSLTLPTAGSTTFRAFAIDRFGNHGTNATLAINVVPNQPPVASLKRGTPVSGTLANGQPFTLQVSATDDLGVTNLTVVGLGTIPFATNFTTGALRTLS